MASAQAGAAQSAEPVVADDFTLRSGHRPGLLKRPQAIFMAVLLLIDVGCVWFSYYLGWFVPASNPAIVIGPFSEFWPLPALHTVILLSIFFMQRMYQRRRPVSHLDEFLKIALLQYAGHVIHRGASGALPAGIRVPPPDRRHCLGGQSSSCLPVARAIHAQVQWQAQARGIGDDRVLVIGAGEIGQMLMQKIQQNPKLGYQIVGMVDNGRSDRRQYPLDAPVLGTLADIPRIIDKYAIDEVFIGLPESSHQELVNIISLCEREKVGIRVFPDVFQIMASEVTIGDLGGLPLLTIRDVALQGWKLTLKRGLDLVGSGAGLGRCSAPSCC